MFNREGYDWPFGKEIKKKESRRVEDVEIQPQPTKLGIFNNLLIVY